YDPLSATFFAISLGTGVYNVEPFRDLSWGIFSYAINMVYHFAFLQTLALVRVIDFRSEPESVTLPCSKGSVSRQLLPKHCSIPSITFMSHCGQGTLYLCILYVFIINSKRRIFLQPQTSST
ncbi:hypothetical protein J437_LFUL000098, partial [Ladona fulva]